LHRLYGLLQFVHDLHQNPSFVYSLLRPWRTVTAPIQIDHQLYLKYLKLSLPIAIWHTACHIPLEDTRILHPGSLAQEMVMGIKLLAFGLAFLFLIQAPLAVAQDATGQKEWATIRAVPFGDKLVIEMKDGKTLKGRFKAVSDKTLTLSQNRGATDVELINLQRVYREGGGSRVKSTLMGAGVGAATGAAIGVGVTVGNEANRREGFHILAGVVLGVIGAGIGAAAGLIAGSRSKRVLIFEAK
jgi:hypothetical protein